MKADHIEKLIEAIKDQFGEILDENAKKIFDAYEEAIDLADGEKKFAYPISVKATITGMDPGSYNVATSAAWTVKQKIQKDTLVRVEPDLVDQMQRSADRLNDAGLEVKVAEPAPSAKAMAGLMAPKRRGRPAKGARAAGGTGQIFGDEDAAGN